MKTLELLQGSIEWHQHRAKSRNASDAPAMLGYSKYKTRNELLREKFTGIVQEVNVQTQYLFDQGHQSEALARPNAEKMLGEDLYPVTVESDDGYLSASLDGLTMSESTIWESKLNNKDLAAYIEANNDLPKTHYPQVEHQLAVTGADHCLFTICDVEGFILHAVRYASIPWRRDELFAGWEQFDEDLANYKLAEVVNETVAAPSLNLPSVSVKVKGEITIIDNFYIFEVALREFIDSRLIRKPQTDQDFADLETQVKTLKKAEEALEAAEAAVVAQVASIDQMKRTKDMLYKLTRDNRLMAEKLVESEKTNRRIAIIDGGKTSFAMHMQTLNTRLGKPYMPVVPVDFTNAAKGKRTITSIQDAVDNELARRKIAANEIADRIEINLKMLREKAADFAFLFSDASTLVLKAADDVNNIIRFRIEDHKAKEQARIDAEVARKLAEERKRQQDEADAMARAKQQDEDREKANAIALELAEANQRARDEIKQKHPEPKTIKVHIAGKPATHEQVAIVSGLARPTDEHIIETLANAYGVSKGQVFIWLAEMKLTDAA